MRVPSSSSRDKNPFSISLFMVSYKLDLLILVRVEKLPFAKFINLDFFITHIITPYLLAVHRKYNYLGLELNIFFLVVQIAYDNM